MARAGEAVASLARRAPLCRVEAVGQLHSQARESHSGLLRRVAQLGEVTFLRRVALELVATPALPAAHALVIIGLAIERQQEIAEALDVNCTCHRGITRFVYLAVTGPVTHLRPYMVAKA